MTEGFVLRSYQPRDIDTMFRLDEECFEEPFRFSHMAMRRFAESRKARVTIAEMAGGLAGFSILHAESHVGYVVTLNIAETFRRRGLARKLMKTMEQHAVDAECAVIGLHVFVRNEGAVQFYEGMGYLRTGDVRGFYGYGLDAWVYRKQMTRA